MDLICDVIRVQLSRTPIFTLWENIYRVIRGKKDLELYRKRNMSATKEQDHREFLNSLRSRLNVDEKTIANLERRITGKFAT